ncbi:MAG: hypothetical protein BroJett031_33990 [Betaproteobacteria bacterium]|nr:MAG: hypothetical protein BroJett031_33990 [Betaproteobacteria bacterium]
MHEADGTPNHCYDSPVAPSASDRAVQDGRTVEALRAEGADELFSENLRRAQNAGRRADLQFAARGYEASLRLAQHDHMASALPNLRKPKPFEGADDLRSRDATQLRHSPVLEP